MKTSRFLLISSFAFALAFAACASNTSSPGTSSLTYHIVPMGDPAPYGSTRGQWSGKWFNWAYSMPSNHNPVQDSAPAETNQSGKVWFLAGAFHPATETRTITIPHGTALFFPILNQGADTTGGWPRLDSLSIICRALWDGNAPRVESAEIDGSAVSNISQYFVDTSRFTQVLVAGNVAGEEACTTVAVSCGDYLMVDSLSTGLHTIHFHGAVAPPASGTPFVLDMTYKVTVQ